MCYNNARELYQQTTEVNRMVFATKPKERFVLTREGAEKLLAQKPMPNQREIVRQRANMLNLVNPRGEKK